MKKKYGFITLINLLLTAACCVGATFAWMAMNSKVESNNMSLQLQDVSNITTLSSYVLKYDGVYGASCISLDDGADISMTEYDKIFTDTNVNTPLIIRLEVTNILTNSQSNITVRIPCNEKYIKRSTGQVNEYVAGYNFSTNDFTNKNDFSIQKYISNVLRITIGAGDNSLVPTETQSAHVENNVTIFNTQHDLLKVVTDEDQTKTFSKIVKNSSSGQYQFSKENEIEVSLDYSDYSNYLFNGSDNTKHLIVYLMLDYDTELMETFIKSLVNEDSASFLNDISTILIENREA